MLTEVKELYKIFKKSSGVSTDTRTIKKNNIFFCLGGDNFDGNDFALEALEKGAQYCVVDNPSLITKSKKFLFVNDTLKSLQDLASEHRDSLNIPIIGITGSNGKTTTKNLIEIALGIKFKVYATKGNLNNHIGVPLSILDISDKYEIGVIEMGASSVGEIETLCKIAKPTCGLITNISNAHIKGFKSFEGVVRGKSELYDYLNKNGGKIFLNTNDDTIKNFSKRFKSAIHVEGKNSNIQVEVMTSPEGEKIYEPKIIFKVRDEKNGVDESRVSKLFGRYNYENIIMAISVAKFFGISESESSKGICSSDLHSNNRSEVISVNKSTIVLDAYNANPVSMKNAIDSVMNFSDNDKLLILGDMNELGDISLEEHTKIGLFTSKLNLRDCFLVGEKMLDAHDINKESRWYKDYDEMEKALSEMEFSGVDVLVKGSRGLRLERVVNLLKRILS